MDVRTPKSIEELQSIIKEWRSKYSSSGRTFFRGQSNRYLSHNGNDWIFPSICRVNSQWIRKDELESRLQVLSEKTMEMGERYLNSPLWTDDNSIRRLLCDKHVCHGLCQHYQLCKTTHLDVTEDFEVAYTFAKYKDIKKGVVFLIRTPRCPHLINVFFEINLYAINLQEIVVPQSTRPNGQKAWSLSFYPEISTLTKELYGPQSFNLARYVDIVVDLRNIQYKPKFEYQTLMVEDEFYKSVTQPWHGVGRS